MIQLKKITRSLMLLGITFNSMIVLSEEITPEKGVGTTTTKTYTVQPEVIKNGSYLEKLKNGETIGEQVEVSTQKIPPPDSKDLPYHNFAGFMEFEQKATEKNIKDAQAIAKKLSKNHASKLESLSREPLDEDEQFKLTDRFTEFRTCVVKVLPMIKKQLGLVQLGKGGDFSRYLLNVAERTQPFNYKELKAGAAPCTYLLPQVLVVDVQDEKLKLSQEAIILTVLARFSDFHADETQQALIIAYANFGIQKLDIERTSWEQKWKSLSVSTIFGAPKPKLIDLKQSDIDLVKKEYLY